ncbi:MAG: uracil-DNA glycosylase family protein [Nitrospiria bacterium]
MSDVLCTKLQDCRECRFWDSEVNRWDEKTGNGKYGCYAINSSARIMIVGQNPSKVRFPSPKNHSLSGRQGDIFREKFGEENLIMTNLVKVSTPNNKINLTDAQHGYRHLLNEIAFWDPDIIICLGNHCKEVVTPRNNIVFLTHPDYYYSYNPDKIPEFEEAVKSIKKMYDAVYGSREKKRGFHEKEEEPDVNSAAI